MTVVQNLAELILNKCLPEKRTVTKICEVIETIIEEVYDIEASQQDSGGSKRTKKITKKGQKDRILVECSL